MSFVRPLAEVSQEDEVVLSASEYSGLVLERQSASYTVSVWGWLAPTTVTSRYARFPHPAEIDYPKGPVNDSGQIQLTFSTDTCSCVNDFMQWNIALLLLKDIFFLFLLREDNHEVKDRRSKVGVDSAFVWVFTWSVAVEPATTWCSSPKCPEPNLPLLIDIQKKKLSWQWIDP